MHGFVQHGFDPDIAHVFVGRNHPNHSIQQSHPDLYFNLSSSQLTVTGSGIQLLLLPTAPIFTQSLDGSLRFTNSASASINAAQGNGGFGANIINTDSGFTLFQDQSTAGLAFIRNTNNPFTLNAGTIFANSSTAGTCKIENTNIGVTVDRTPAMPAPPPFSTTTSERPSLKARAGRAFATLQVVKRPPFSTPIPEQCFSMSRARLRRGLGRLPALAALRLLSSTETGGFTIFTDQSSATFAQITNRSNGGPGGVTEFRGNSIASLSTILNIEAGVTNFTGQSFADRTVTIGNGGQAITGGTLNFFDSSRSAATITNNNGGQTNFHNLSTASLGEFNSLITNNSGGQTTFYDSSSAGAATINNNDGGSLNFFNNSTAGTATINNACGSQFGVHDSASAENATVLTAACPSIKGPQDQAFVIFTDQSTGGQAQFTINTGGVMDISGLTTTGMTAGSIAGAGTFFLAPSGSRSAAMVCQPR